MHPLASEAARRILRAAESGDLARLEGELGRVAGRPPPAGDVRTDGVERAELLDAVAQAMLDSLDRMRWGLTDRLEGGRVHLKLLRHLSTC